MDASLIGYIFAINGFTVFLFQIQFMPMLEFYSVFLLEKYLYCHSRKPEKMIGRYLGLYAMTAVAGWSAGPYIGGKILEWVDFDFQIAWQIISLFALSAGVGYTLLDTTLRIRGSLREM